MIEYFFDKDIIHHPTLPIFWIFLAFLIGALALALLLWWWRDKLLNQGVVIDLTVDQIGKPADRSSEWANNAMTAFAVIHHPFALGKLQQGSDHEIDISLTLREAITDYETLLWRHHGNDKLVLVPGGRNFAAQFGLGALAYLPGEMTLIEAVGRRSWNTPRHFIEFTGEDIRDRVEKAPHLVFELGLQEVGAPREISETSSGSKVSAGQLTGVKIVRFAFATVRGQNIQDWTPFLGTELEHAEVPTVYAGALGHQTDGKIHFTDVSLYASSLKGHLHRSDDTTPELDALDAAEHLATTLAWTLWRYPDADVHVTARVPRTVAVAAGAILAARPEWQVGSRTVTLPDFTARLKLWGSLRPAELKETEADTAPGKAAKVVPAVEPDLALFNVFAQRTATLPHLSIDAVARTATVTHEGHSDA